MTRGITAVIVRQIGGAKLPAGQPCFDPFRLFLASLSLIGRLLVTSLEVPSAPFRIAP